jgi:hypothetical protein
MEAAAKAATRVFRGELGTMDAKSRMMTAIHDTPSVGPGSA